MSDPCSVCHCHGDLALCEARECSIRESWYAQTMAFQLTQIRCHLSELFTDADLERFCVRDGPDVHVQVLRAITGLQDQMAAKAKELEARLAEKDTPC